MRWTKVNRYQVKLTEEIRVCSNLNRWKTSVKNLLHAVTKHPSAGILLTTLTIKNREQAYWCYLRAAVAVWFSFTLIYSKGTKRGWRKVREMYLQLSFELLLILLASTVLSFSLNANGLTSESHLLCRSSHLTFYCLRWPFMHDVFCAFFCQRTTLDLTIRSLRNGDSEAEVISFFGLSAAVIKDKRKANTIVTDVNEIHGDFCWDSNFPLIILWKCSVLHSKERYV